MNQFKSWLYRFMYGRYGSDQLYVALLIAYAVLCIINAFVQSLILSFLMWGLFLYAMFRCFSKNIAKRQAENRAFLKLYTPVKNKCKLTWNRIRECRTHVYRTCPYCKATLRLPRRKGTHNASCPCCHSRVEVKSLF